ncbi:MAG TPA: ATP-binding protein [Burkholderiaceae bacterium]|nr:ATP-binding protein [Burkholderiaceae bacterium]
MFKRLAAARIEQTLGWSPAVALLGPRQVGKSTLARAIAERYPGALMLDLERAQARERLANAEAFLAANRGRLVVLDEVQYLPGLFQDLRVEIDAERRPGRFLLLGSASFALLRQSESLAGRLAVVDMAPLLLPEVTDAFAEVQTLWLRGGFPDSYAARDEAASLGWRESFIRHLLATDLPALGIAVDAESLRRFWRMAAHLHGQLFNASAVATSLGVSQPTVTRWLDHLTQALLLRRLEPYHANLGKRLVKSAKVYVRDSGLLHSLLGLRDVNDLLGHPGTGASWEGFCIEQIAGLLPPGAQMSFYRTTAGAELDLVVEFGRRKIGFEIKFSSAPKVGKGFWQACRDVGVERAYVVAPVAQGWAMKVEPGAAPVSVVGPLELAGVVAGMA